MKEKLMIVDDDPDILITLRSIFEDEGFEVFTVDSGNDCIRELNDGFNGIIIMDIMMPFMNGWETIRDIIKKKLIKNIKISVLTASDLPNKYKLKELDPYIKNYIRKPFDVKELIKDINNMKR